jgi:ABC-type sulfate/molybdate transport systems ATPase subunit
MLRHQRGGREVLRIDELSVTDGQRLAVLGPNGSGKTTLLRLLAGLEPPTEGSVRLDGCVAHKLPLAARRSIGYVTQHPGLLTTSVRHNVELPLAWRGIPRAARQGRAMAALERLSVDHLADRPAHRVSGGERQRINLARSLVLEPTVLLLDEPAAFLDPQARAAFLEDLDRALTDSPTTVVHVSHRPEEAVRGADQVAVLDRGTIRQLGPPAEVFRAPADPRVARILGYQNLLPIIVHADGAVTLNGEQLLNTELAWPRAATLGVWANGIELEEPEEGALVATVQTVTPGPGRWEVILSYCGARLVAFARSDQLPPQLGQQVALRLLPDLCATMPASCEALTFY